MDASIHVCIAVVIKLQRAKLTKGDVLTKPKLKIIVMECDFEEKLKKAEQFIDAKVEQQNVHQKYLIATREGNVVEALTLSGLLFLVSFCMLNIHP